MSEIIGAEELAKRWKVPETWVRSQTRARTVTAEQIPHLRFGRYLRFEWGSPALEEWLMAHRKGAQR